ncbi:uncharacterized protein LOC144435910 [Glandiceps talaboti]
MAAHQTPDELSHFENSQEGVPNTNDQSEEIEFTGVGDGILQQRNGRQCSTQWQCRASVLPIPTFWVAYNNTRMRYNPSSLRAGLTSAAVNGVGLFFFALFFILVGVFMVALSKEPPINVLGPISIGCGAFLSVTALVSYMCQRRKKSSNSLSLPTETVTSFQTVPMVTTTWMGQFPPGYTERDQSLQPVAPPEYISQAPPEYEDGVKDSIPPPTYDEATKPTIV